MIRYDVRSPRADDFINHQEILDTLAYAAMHRHDAALARSILEKARANLTPAHDHGTTLTHREASVLLACEDPEVNAEIRQLARDIKQAYYGNRIVLFAPLYLSNYCVNGCLYCPYHATNRDIPRRKLTQEEIRAEVIALQDMGHKRLAIEAGEDPAHNPLSYILESLETIYGTVPATKSCTPQAPRPATPGTLRPTTAPWPPASTTWGSACCSVWKAMPTSSPAFSCTRSIWKPCSA